MRFIEGKIEKSVLQLGAEYGNESEESEAIIISLEDGHIHEIPCSLQKESQIESFLEQYIKTIHPGPYDQLATDWFSSGRGQKRQIYFVVMEIVDLEIYKDSGRKIYAPFQLKYRTKNGINIPKVKTSFSRPLFSKKRENTVPHLIVLTIMACLLVFSVLGVSNSIFRNKVLQSELDKARLEMRQDISPESSTIIKTSRDELKQELSMLRSTVPKDLYSILGILSENEGVSLNLEFLQYGAENIILKGRSTETLALIEKLYETELFNEITPENILPEDDGQEYYHITGVLK